MTRAALICVLLLTQEQSEVDKQAARITDKDPAASFDAISRLIDLAATSKPAVEAAAAKVSDSFYRTVLEEELKARERLGAKFGTVTRISIDVKDKTLASVLQELTEKSKEKLDAYWVMQSRGSQGVTVKINDAPVLEAVRAICAEAHLRATLQYGLIQIYEGGGVGNGPACQYRNFLISAWSLQKTREIELGGPANKILYMQLQALWDRAIMVARAEKSEIIECVDNKGRAIPVAPEEAKPPSTADPAVISNGLSWGWAPSVRLQWPAEDAEKIARLRGAFTILVPDATASVVLKEKGAKATDDAFEATLEGMRSERNRAEAVVRIKPASLDEFRKMTVGFRVKVKDGDERWCYATGRVTDGVVEYTVSPRLTGEESSGRKVIEIESVEVMVIKTTLPRRIFYEFRDVPLK